MQSDNSPEDPGSNPPNEEATAANDNNSQELNSATLDGESASASEAGGNAADLPTGGASGDAASGSGDVEEITEGASAIHIGGEEEEEEVEDDIPPAGKYFKMNKIMLSISKP